MKIQEAIQRLIEKFPFPGYTDDPAFGKKGAYANIAETVIKHVPPGSKILDFGSGPCDKAAVLQYLGFQMSGYDDLQDDWHQKPGNRDIIASFAKEAGIDFELAVDHSIPFEKDQFDMVMLHDVLEHLHDSPRELLNDLIEIIKPGGLLFITVPNIVNIRKRVDVLFGKTNLPRFEVYYWYPGKWRGHVREYSKADLIQLSEYLDIEIVELRGCDHMLAKLPVSIHPIYLFVTGIFTGWKDTWLFVAKKKSGWVPRKNLSERENAKLAGDAV